MCLNTKYFFIGMRTSRSTIKNLERTIHLSRKKKQKQFVNNSLSHRQ